MKQVALTGQGPREQVASVGCSIKWKADARRRASGAADIRAAQPALERH
jgi:hypothetical protein